MHLIIQKLVEIGKLRKKLSQLRNELSKLKIYVIGVDTSNGVFVLNNLLKINGILEDVNFSINKKIKTERGYVFSSSINVDDVKIYWTYTESSKHENI